jgi:tetratricopeptide (TPR) repeat protein
MKLLNLLLCASSLLAQHAPAPKSGDRGKIVAKPWPGYGDLHFPVESQSKEAAAWANQGMRLVYAFNHAEAAASFRQATALDPACSLCWWGLAYSLGNNINAPLFPENAAGAYESAQRALATAQSPREKAYAQALAARYAKENPSDRRSLDQAFAQAMKQAAQGLPDDLNAQVIYADALMNLTPWKLFDRQGKANTYTEEVIQILEAVLNADPEHLGANHLYIHAVEASTTPERALQSSYRLATLAPASGHLVHMPSHIFMRTGDHERAAQVNATAAALDKAYFESVGGPTYYTPYWVHNLHFLSAARSMQGRYQEARAAIAECAEKLEPLARTMPAYEASLAMPLLLEVRFQQWDKILALPEPASASLSVRNAWLFARGMAQAAKGDAPEAKRTLGQFRSGVASLAADRSFGLNLEKDVMAIAAHLLEAKILYAKQDYPAAIQALRQAVALEDQLSYDEPADWYYPPTREALGALLLAAGQALDAEAVFRQELQNNRRSGRALFGLHASLLAQNKLEAAAMVQPLFQAAWSKADAPLSTSQLF